MRLAIIGSRNCPPVDIAAQLKYIPDTIVSGGARGADTYSREFAKAHNLQLVEYLPDYEKYGKGVPLVRNKLIVENCDLPSGMVYLEVLSLLWIMLSSLVNPLKL